MNKILVLAMVFSRFVNAEFYSNLRCSSTSPVMAKGKDTQVRLKPGSFDLVEVKSQTLVVLNGQNKVLLKVFPWFGVDYIESSRVSVLEKLTTSSTDFHFKFEEKKNKKIHFLKCRKTL